MIDRIAALAALTLIAVLLWFGGTARAGELPGDATGAGLVQSAPPSDAGRFRFEFGGLGGGIVSLSKSQGDWAGAGAGALSVRFTWGLPDEVTRLGVRQTFVLAGLPYGSCSGDITLGNGNTCTGKSLRTGFTIAPLTTFVSEFRVAGWASIDLSAGIGWLASGESGSMARIPAFAGGVGAAFDLVRTDRFQVVARLQADFLVGIEKVFLPQAGLAVRF